MKAYKGFFKDEDGRLYCQPSSSADKFYYEEGNTYTLPEGEEPELCYTGFHACTLPTDVFKYYNSFYDNVEFHEVEVSGTVLETIFDSKVVGNKITIGRKITPDEMVEISIKIMLEDKEKYFAGGMDAVFVMKDFQPVLVRNDGTVASGDNLKVGGVMSVGSYMIGTGKARFDRICYRLAGNGKLIPEKEILEGNIICM